MKVQVQYLEQFKDRHGKQRLYFRKNGVRIAPYETGSKEIRGPIGSPEFWEDYNAALQKAVPKRPSNSVESLINKYYQSAAFKGLGERTQYVRRGILKRFCKKNGHHPYNTITRTSLVEMRDAMADRPESANGIIKALRQVYAYALDYGLMDTNPALTVPYLRTKSDGFHAWTLQEIEQFEERHPIGTKPRLALSLLLYTGQRRGDIVTMGRQHVKAGWISFKQQKTGKRMEIPMLVELRKIIEESPTGDMTFLQTQFGKPFTNNGFGNWFRRRCDEAGLKGCSAHGLRKSAGYRMAELGCTAHEIAAILGHDTLKEVERYTRAAERKKLAARAGDKLSKLPNPVTKTAKP